MMTATAWTHLGLVPPKGVESVQLDLLDDGGSEDGP
jgi:hypothetical protein